MAGLLSEMQSPYRLLDPGAGVGCLTAAAVDRFAVRRDPGTLEVHCFENDPALVVLLRQTLEHCRSVLATGGHRFVFVIHAMDFIADQASLLAEQKPLFGASDLGKFDAVIMNPPYFKLRKDSKHARLMAHIVPGQPNAYASFLILAAALLKNNGELAAITPRSFCNGLYFRDFRRLFFGRMQLEHAHLFESRTETFKEFGVLQESLITKTRRSAAVPSCVTVTSTVGRDMRSPTLLSVPTREILDRSDRDIIVRVPITKMQRNVVRAVDALPTRFSELGLRISTGPVVLFRAKDFLMSVHESGRSIPLLMPHNLTGMWTTWPRIRADKPQAFRLCEESRRLMTRKGNYVLLKRFSAKEERRRLVASCLFARHVDTTDLAIENHLNYIYHSERQLSEAEVVGIATLLNSQIIDCYYRAISGNTQVNATDVRRMPFPKLDLLAAIGQQILATPDSLTEPEDVVLDALGIVGDTRVAVKP